VSTIGAQDLLAGLSAGPCPIPQLARQANTLLTHTGGSEVVRHVTPPGQLPWTAKHEHQKCTNSTQGLQGSRGEKGDGLAAEGRVRVAPEPRFQVLQALTWAIVRPVRLSLSTWPVLLNSRHCGHSQENSSPLHRPAPPTGIQGQLGVCKLSQSHLSPGHVPCCLDAPAGHPTVVGGRGGHSSRDRREDTAPVSRPDTGSDQEYFEERGALMSW
jgi:hypothetical protein